MNALGWGGWSAGTEGPMKMLYACDNVRTVTTAKINMPPMKAFRAPGFVEGTFGLECLIDELAAKLDVDPLELRRKNYASSNDGTPFSSKNLEECYRRREALGPARRGARALGRDVEARRRDGEPDLVRRRRAAVVRVDARRLRRPRAVVTAMQDIGTGTRTAMAQIAAEELGVPLERVEVMLGDTARGPYATLSAGSSTTPSMGPAVRAARGRREASRSRRSQAQRGRAADGTAVSLEILEMLGNAQILGKGARGPNPTGMSVLTFGVHVVEVAVDVETGEVRVERVAAIHDVGRIINPLGASSQVEGGVIQGIGHTLSEQRLIDQETGAS